MAACLISIGSNLGDRSLAIDSALAGLQANPAIVLRRVSSRHITRAIGGPAGQDEFVNAAALVETALPPLELLRVLQNLESQAGRTRDIRWGARTLDLDLLLYDDLVMNDEQLVLPHPRMAFRYFVLDAAVEIAPKMLHPVLGRSIMQLLTRLDQALNYVAITGVPGVGKTQLVEAVAARVDAVAIIEGRPTGTFAGLSAGRTAEAELDLISDRGDLLQDVLFPRNQRYAISDFWFGQSLAYARHFSIEDYRLIEVAVVMLEVASPKLVVLVEATFEDSPRDEQTESLLAIQQDLRCELLSPGQPPMLRLDAANPAWNEAEIIAAIQAM